MPNKTLKCLKPIKVGKKKVESVTKKVQDVFIKRK